MVSWWPLIFIVVGFLTIVVSTVLSNHRGKAEWWHWLILVIGILFIIGGIIWYIIEKGNEKTIQHLVLHKENSCHNGNVPVQYVNTGYHVPSTLQHSELRTIQSRAPTLKHEVESSTVVHHNGPQHLDTIVQESYKHTDTANYTKPHVNVVHRQPTISTIQPHNNPRNNIIYREPPKQYIQSNTHNVPRYVQKLPNEGRYIAEWHSRTVPTVHETHATVVTAPVENIVVPIHVETHEAIH